MLPPPGFMPTGATPFDDGPTPTALLSSMAFAIATIVPTSTPALSLGFDLSSVTQAVATTLATLAAAEGASGDDEHPPPNGECKLLGPFALLVQGALGGLALLALVFKRWRERPQRPVKIWFFDVSKQVVGSILVHIANLLMSMLSSGQLTISAEPSSVESRMVDSKGHYQPNPCSFYLLNLAIDTTIGIPILILLLRVYTELFAMTPFGQPRESIESGHYGSPPKAWWWFKQSLIYFLGLLGMKVCVLVIFLVLPWISRVGDWALRWTEGNEELQVFFVMLFFPVIMNATQYYIIDSFIKNQKPTDHELIPSVDGDTDEDDVRCRDSYGGPASGSSDEINSGDEEDAPAKATPETKTQSTVRSKSKTKSGMKDEYDPALDGESGSTDVGSGSSGERGGLLKKELGNEDAPKSSGS